MSGRWEGTARREGESGRPGEQRETLDQRREREQAAKAQAPRPQADRPPQGDVEETVEGFTPRRPYRNSRGRFTSLPEAPQEGVLRLTPRQSHARQVKALVAWLRTYLKDGPAPAAPIRRAVRSRKIRARALREACMAEGVMSYLTREGEYWSRLKEGVCVHCQEHLLCLKCGRSALLPQGVELLYPLSVAARLCLMTPGSLRTYVNRHKVMYPPRYRRRRGGSYERVLTGAEVRMLYSYVLHSTLYGKRKMSSVVQHLEEG